MTREVLKQTISFQLSSDSGVPAYLQLVQQIKQAMRMGVLQVGDKLPTVKEVVAEVAINPNTVMKAYWELEHEGLVEGRQGGARSSSCPARTDLHRRTQARLARRPGALGRAGAQRGARRRVRSSRFSRSTLRSDRGEAVA